MKTVCYICSKDGHRAEKCLAKDTRKILAHRRLFKPLLTLDDLDAAQVYSLSNKAPEISEEMIRRVPDYYDDMDILTDEDDDENDENDFNAQGSSTKTKKRNLYEDNDDEDSSSDN